VCNHRIREIGTLDHALAWCLPCDKSRSAMHRRISDVRVTSSGRGASSTSSAVSLADGVLAQHDQQHARGFSGVNRMRDVRRHQHQRLRGRADLTATDRENKRAG